MAQYVYPAVFESEKDGGFSIFFPDLEGCYTCGDTIADGMNMANDALALMLYRFEKEGRDIPAPTPIESVRHKKNAFVTYIACDTLVYRKRHNNKAVKKTLSIPEWMDEAATAAGLNFSQTLQDALKEKLGAVTSA